MFKKIFNLVFGLLMIALFITNVSEAQTKKIEYPIFAISPLVGVQFPLGGLNDGYNTSWNAGLDFTLKVNRETGFFFKVGYYNMPGKSITTTIPDASYIEITAGPRYVFTSPKIKAKFFLEAGLGAYIFHQKEFTMVGTTTVIPDVSKTSFGVNVGPGVEIPLGGSVNLITKAKLHYTFETVGRTFVAATMGVEFNL